MEAIILSKEQFLEINNRLDEISNHLSTKTTNSEQFIDNTDFLQLMKISKRTAQNWRDEGKIGFSQVGGKIYYQYADIEEFLKQHYKRAFSRDIKSKLGL